MIDKIKADKRYGFLLSLSFVSIALFCGNYNGTLRSYNSTMLALSYKYGFTSRSLLGTIYHVINRLLPINMIDYRVAVVFATIVTALFFLYVLHFCKVCVFRCDEKYLPVVEVLLSAFVICTVSTFSFCHNFFRVDLFMMWMSCIGVEILLKGKQPWLAVVCALIGILFHQGYIFMYFNMILVFFIYRWLSGKRNKKYFFLTAISFVSCTVLLFWFELFSRTNGLEIFPAIEAEAKALSFNGVYHTTLLYHEVLGIDLSASERGFVRGNLLQSALLFILLFPLWKGFLQTCASVVKRASGFQEKFKYFIIVAGGLTMLPDYLLKVDYGRWYMAVFAYYLVITVVMILEKDPVFLDVIDPIQKKWSKKNSWIVVYLLLVVLFVPFMDVDINPLLRDLATWLDANFLHFY